MIRLVSGNMFNSQVGALVNTVNCVGVMGAGVALQFKLRYPEMFHDYVHRCRGGFVRPGQPYVWKAEESLFGSDSRIVINFPTKDDWRNPSEYSYIESGLRWLRGYLLQSPGLSIAIPALGCGYGGLDWKVVEGMILSALGDLEKEILLFAPHNCR